MRRTGQSEYKSIANTFDLVIPVLYRMVVGQVGWMWMRVENGNGNGNGMEWKLDIGERVHSRCGQ